MQSLICKTQATNHDKSVLSLVHVGGGGETKWGGAEDNESHLKLFIKTSPKNAVFLVIAKLGGGIFWGNLLTVTTPQNQCISACL